jgi:hypothetical protein
VEAAGRAALRSTDSRQEGSHLAVAGPIVAGPIVAGPIVAGPNAAGRAAVRTERDLPAPPGSRGPTAPVVPGRTRDSAGAPTAGQVVLAPETGWAPRARRGSADTRRAGDRAHSTASRIASTPESPDQPNYGLKRPEGAVRERSQVSAHTRRRIGDSHPAISTLGCPFGLSRTSNSKLSTVSTGLSTARRRRKTACLAPPARKTHPKVWIKCDPEHEMINNRWGR